jgi:hypothetical protein
MHAHHQLGVVGGLHQRIPIPVLVVDRGEPERRRILRERDAAGAFPRAPLDLAGSVGRVPQGHDDERDVATRCRAAPLVDHPVVVRPDTQKTELLVLGVVERLPAEPRERGKTHGREHAGAVHVGEARDRIEATRPHLVVGHRQRAELFFALPRGRREARGGHALAFEEPRLSVLVAHHPRPGIAKPRGSRSCQTCGGSITWSSTEISQSRFTVVVGIAVIRPLTRYQRGC